MDLGKIGNAIAAALALLEGEVTIIENHDLRNEFEQVINLLEEAINEIDSEQ